MGRGTLKIDEDWPGPGEAYPMDFAEHNQREFHREWFRYMADDGQPTAVAAVNGAGQASRTTATKG